MKNNVEVQDGYVGRVIPFELAQKILLPQQLESLKKSENRLSQVTADYAEMLELFSEDEKEDYKEIFNDNQDSFVNAEVTKLANQLKKAKAVYEDDTVECRIVQLSDLISEERELKRELKKQSDQLLKETKETIENLTDAQALELLEEKWITPIVDSLKKLPTVLIEELTNKIKKLSGKYETTYLDIESDIRKAENDLSSLIDELTGDEFDMQGLKEFQKMLGGGENA